VQRPYGMAAISPRTRKIKKLSLMITRAYKSNSDKYPRSLEKKMLDKLLLL